jgi:hypothetical protein
MIKEVDLRFICIPLYSRWIYTLIVRLPTLTPSTKCEYYVQITRRRLLIHFWVTLLPSCGLLKSYITQK